MTDTIALILVLVPALVIAIVFHEVAHGYAARLLGDPTASERGRLTLNPGRHASSGKREASTQYPEDDWQTATR